MLQHAGYLATKEAHDRMQLILTVMALLGAQQVTFKASQPGSCSICSYMLDLRCLLFGALLLDSSKLRHDPMGAAFAVCRRQ
jgi:L-asparaginase II